MIGRLSIARKLALVFALGPVAIAALAVLGYISTQNLLTARERVLHTYDVRNTIASMEKQSTKSLADERGYLLSGREVVAKAYLGDVVAFQASLAKFAGLTADNPHQQERARVLRRTFDADQRIRSETMAIRRAKGLAGLLKTVPPGLANALSARIQSTLQDADNEEDRLQVERDVIAENAANATLYVSLLGAAAVILALIIIAIVSIRSLSRPIEQAIARLAAATAEIVAGTTQQAAGVQEQAAAVAQTVATVEEITQTAEQSNERAKAVVDSSRRATDGGALGRRSVESTIVVMGDIKTRTELIAQSILSLAKQAQAIGEIIAVVNDLAEQTNILALNASIEATRAGEQGKGFSVVAAEIKALADQSKRATVQVRQILAEIQKSTNAAVMATEQGTKSVDEAMQIVNNADEAIRLLLDTITEAAQASTSISTSVGQQVVGMSQIQSAMRNIDQATSQNLSSTQQAERAARNLDEIGLRLRLLLRGANGVAG
ncbi:MAG TPA: methyl-accepting chemotaxis protein [Candidatus Acidoferrales bacterium]|nr:methyl-accepting chemotaxis protein [Candidatus Acidoferrales bacterium]